MISQQMYFALPNLERKMCPLQFWQSEGHRFPHLQKLTLKYLCVPTTSVPSERIFSKSGELISKRRSRLKPKNVHACPSSCITIGSVVPSMTRRFDIRIVPSPICEERFFYFYCCTIV
ncbi:hypothetical protein ANANG_G00100150 [Anguilla anguilla]|uniref:HAT C-terminal dimerisation domain-containing protein n=1 Tax=Anguilla anguilla TaxID=7936 RepID=A0A9D3RZ45_ANGAN|nr:hypothetical protein ANANG_G00100150 [Anguilla anguilla]